MQEISNKKQIFCLLIMFSERKVAQMAAYLLSREKDNRLSHKKLMKLLYLADRESMKQFHYPISGDEMVSAFYGPMLSKTLAYMDGDVESSMEDGWASWILSKEDNEFALKKSSVELENLDELSIADIDVLDTVWNAFGVMSGDALSDYTHENCREWRSPPDNSSIPTPILYGDVFRALDYPDDVAKELEDACREEDRVGRVFSNL